MLQNYLMKLEGVVSIVGISRAAVAESTKVPLFSRTVFTGCSSGLNPVLAKIRYLLLFREFQLVDQFIIKLYC